MTLTDREGAGGRLQLAGERLPFAMLPRWLLYHPDANEGAKFLYCVLHDLVQGRQGPTRPVTRAELAAACGVSADTIDRRLAQLVAVGAVEKEHQIRSGGQQANIYRVWLTPPDGLHRRNAEPVDDRRRASAAPVGQGATGLVNRGRESAAPPPGPQPCGTSGRAGAAPKKKEQEQETPPQPPRPAGGPEADTGKTSRRAGTNPRALGTHPRAEAELAEAARLEAEAAARQAELDRVNAARRAADLAARLEADRLEAEALAVSAALDDDRLAAVVAVVTAGLAGPLARSPLAVSRAVVGWVRAAAAHRPGPLAAAVDAGLAAGLAAGEAGAPLTLPVAPEGTPTLRQRIAARRRGEEDR